MRELSLVLQQVMMDAVERKLEPIRDAELVVDLAQVVLDDLFGGAEFDGDLLVEIGRASCRERV